MGRRLRLLRRRSTRCSNATPDGFVLTDEGTAVMGDAERMEEEALALQRQLADSREPVVQSPANLVL
jgi:ferredoxin